METFQYKIVPMATQFYYEEEVNVDSLEQQLNQLGEQGWELMEFLGNGQYMLFKRRVTNGSTSREDENGKI